MNQDQRDAVLLDVRNKVDIVTDEVRTIKLVLQNIDTGGSVSDVANVEIGLLAFIAGAVVALVFVIGLKLG